MERKRSIYVINGPNLNLLGKREPGVYGTKTLDDLKRMLTEHAQSQSADVVLKQSNHEGDIIDWIHEADQKSDGVVLNPGAFTHYSYAIRDAVASVTIPVVEVHISNIHAREEFRKTSVIADEALGQISGFGFNGYLLAFDAIYQYLGGRKDEQAESIKGEL